ncbi:MAG: KpsF/GutQ family sugar-phosphate isomerase [Gammaproteobacteria bacterium]|nr:KpsF/GutQ family sugar-phosphate isomerase [Gammaproteobacteria bacterium]
MSTIDKEKVESLARKVLTTEAQAVTALADRIDDQFSTACQLCIDCRGRIVVTGMGKSGHIGNKIAATLASTGSPAFFVHSGEASHGDLGMITGEDLVLAVSNSGETKEIITILPLIKRLAVPMITLTGNPNSTLAKAADINLDVSVAEEACPINLTPTASTTATLAMGDALAVALLESRGFTEVDFARSHPGGSLGRRLLLHVDDLMHTGDRIPRVAIGTPLSEGLVEMSRKSLGMTAIVDKDGKLAGVFTDGDLRRSLDNAVDVHTTPIEQVMTKNGKTVRADMLAVEAVNLLETHKITALIVVDEDGKVIGALNVHDLLRAGIM